MTVYMTEAGGLCLLRAMRGESLVFTHVSVGSGANTSSPTQATELVHEEQVLDIDSSDIQDGLLTLICSFTNSNVTTGFRITEYGIFVQDMDDEDEEVLFAYILQPYDTADYVPAGNDRPKSLQIAPKVIVGDAQNISAVIHGSLTYVSEEEFHTHTNNKSNPHEVTKSQLGLGNVENVSPSNMCPDFGTVTPNATYSNLKINAGEKMSQILSKVSSFIQLGIRHLLSRSNPHEVTLDQLGGASRGHTHNVTDISAGVLPISRGGTGFSSVSIGAVLIGDSTGISQRTGQKAFFKAPGELAPRFGVLPVVCGGTGVDTEVEYTADLLTRVTGEGVPIIVHGEYTGNGDLTVGVTLEFSQAPKLIVITKKDSGNINYAEEGSALYAVRGTVKIPNISFTWGDDYVKFVGASSGVNAQYSMNVSGAKYNYIALL